MGFLDKVKGLVSKNADKVETAIDKAGDIVDQKTQGKYTSQVDKVNMFFALNLESLAPKPRCS